MRRILAVLPALLVAACSHPASETDAPPATPPAQLQAQAQDPAPASKTRPVIATIVTHDARVSILGSGTGSADALRVTVRKLDGQLVADAVTLDQLERVDPIAAAIVSSAVAKNDGTSYVDARLDRLDRPRPVIHAGF